MCHVCGAACYRGPVGLGQLARLGRTLPALELRCVPRNADDPFRNQQPMLISGFSCVFP